MEKNGDDLHIVESSYTANNEIDHQTSAFDVAMKGNREDKSFRCKLFLHGIICFTMFIYGWTFSMKGPAFTDLIMIVGVGSGAGSVFVSATFVGMLSGSILCGFIIDRYNQHLVMAFASFCFGCSTFAIPLCSIYWIMVIAHGLQGLGCGIVLTGGLTICGQLWGTGASARSFLQSVQVCMPVGAILSPLVVAPFLSIDSSKELSVNNTQQSYAINVTSLSYPTLIYSLSTTSVSPMWKYGVTDSNHISSVTNRGMDAVIKDQRIIIPFSISSAMTLLSGVLFMVMFCKYPRQKSVEMKRKGDQSKIVEQNQSMSLVVRIVRLYLVGQLGFVDKGIENAFVQFFPAFLHSKMGWTKVLSSDIMSVFWGPFAFGRLIGIAISYYMKSKNLMLSNIFLLILSAILLLVATHADLDSLMWVVAVSTGIAFSTIAPCLVSWSHSEILSTSGKHNSFIITTCCLGSVILPLVVGNLVELDYVWYVYMLAASSVFLLVNYVCLAAFVRTKLKNGVKETTIVDSEKEVTKMMK